MFRPTEFHVIDGINKYTIDSFAVQFNIIIWTVLTMAMNLYTEYFANMNRYQYEYLELTTHAATLLTTLYITFIDNILSYPNMSLPGSVSPAKVSTFSITTNWSYNDLLEPNSVIVRLYWDTYLYICTLSLNLASTTYICDVSNASQVISTCTDPMYPKTPDTNLFAIFIEKQEIDQRPILIDSISVTDESGRIYELETFCQDKPWSDSNIDGEGQIGLNQIRR